MPGIGCPTLIGRDIQLQAINNFVCGALPGDTFVFFCEFRYHLLALVELYFPLDAGHSGQQEAIDDPNEDDGLDECASEPILRLLSATDE
jgi:hypothetical protein